MRSRLSAKVVSGSSEILRMVPGCCRHRGPVVLSTHSEVLFAVCLFYRDTPGIPALAIGVSGSRRSSRIRDCRLVEIGVQDTEAGFSRRTAMSRLTSQTGKYISL